MSSSRILAFAGSSRRESFNGRLLSIAVAGAEQAGADVTRIELADFPLPIMDQDLQEAQGLPAGAVALKKLFLEHNGLLMACPEYNSSVTPLWKNAIDWVSRQSPDDPPGGLAAFRGKVAAIMSASPGRLGGMRGLVHVRSILGNIGVLVLPNQVSVSEASHAFTEDGRLKDEKRHASVEDLGAQLAETVRRLSL